MIAQTGSEIGSSPDPDLLLRKTSDTEEGNPVLANKHIWTSSFRIAYT